MNATDIANYGLIAVSSAFLVMEAIHWLRLRRRIRARRLNHTRAFVQAYDAIFADRDFPEDTKKTLRLCAGLIDQPEAAKALANILSRTESFDRNDAERPERVYSNVQMELYLEAMLAFCLALSYQHRRGTIIRDHLAGREIRPGLVCLFEKFQGSPPKTRSGNLIAAH